MEDVLSTIVWSSEMQGTVLSPKRPNGWGVLVLHGSSGQPDIERSRLLADCGAVTFALRWFGGEGQAPGICEIPLETFSAAIDCLVTQGCKHIAIIGTSKGAEAALLTAVYDSRVDVVVAVSPSSVIWGNIGPGLDGVEWPQRSSWTMQGHPLPFVASDPYWQRQKREGLISYRSLFEQSLQRFSREAEAAEIIAEKISADVLLVAGEDDALWPSDFFARALVARRASSGKRTELFIHPKARHRIPFPGEIKLRSSRHAHGGSDEGDRELGRQVWEAICLKLGLDQKCWNSGQVGG